MTVLTGYDTCHCLALRRGSRHITRLYDTHLASAGVTTSQFSIMSVIDKRPEIRVSELGAIMVMERTTLLRSLKPLLTEGWITSTKADGERAHVFKLTPLGKQRLEKAAPLWREAQASFEAAFGAERAERLRSDNLAVGAVEAL